MNKNQKQVADHVSLSIEPGTTITEVEIKKSVDFFSIMYPINEEEKNEVIKILHARFAIRMDRGAFVKDNNHVSWYYSAKKDSKLGFWDRYVKYLIKDLGLSHKVINSLDGSTDEMMDLLGNPKEESNFQRRGLIIGDVQSGKTATYTALINKAADEGYRIIILLTGTIEKLRMQTQARLDEGFIGLDSTAFNRDSNNELVGVGNYDSSIYGWAVTSTSSDFKKSTGEKLTGRLSGISVPVLFVLKKNKSVLEKLEQWLRVYNATLGQKCPLPMLLIDDEADNASVNTKTNDDPTVINANIRKLLKLFSKANYVGFTATPFANIFIDPESDNEMLKDDLFPRDFIYALEAPTNYVGARNIFPEDGSHAYMLKGNEDCENFLPEKHNKDFSFQELPPSLKKAIASFFITNAVRDLRGHGTKHRTMLVNISRFIHTQESIAKVVDTYVRDLQREIKNYSLIGHEALNYESLTHIKSVFDDKLVTNPNLEYTWEDIQPVLHKAIASIVVRTVNGGNASKNLNYEEFKDEGLRLIAVGGFSLSRGLTLEGLCISYFYRNSKMYDTLMQMGRWFGYRDGYADLCQIWMSDDAISWYREISEASDELRQEVRKMQNINKTPREFGLSVRSNKKALVVTAANKMKTAADFTRTVSLNGDVIETPYMHFDKAKIASNLHNTELWIKTLSDNGYIFQTNEDLALKNLQTSNIPKKNIIEYLSSFNSHYLNILFNTENLVEIISKSNDGTLEKWDVVIAEGDSKRNKFCGFDIKFVRRKFRIKYDKKAIQMSGRNSRLGSTNLAKGGLTKLQVKDVEEKIKQFENNKSISQEDYFKSGIKRNPLLVIYPVELSPSPLEDIKNEQLKASQTFSPPIIGLSIGIPNIDGKASKKYLYKINSILYKQLMDIDEDDKDYEEEVETQNQDEGGSNE